MHYMSTGIILLFFIISIGCTKNNNAESKSPLTMNKNKQLAQQILADSTLNDVLGRAKKVIGSGFNAGDGYGEVWIRDFNTFIEISCKITEKSDIRDNLLMFFRFQGDDGNIIDGFIPKSKKSVGYDFIERDDIPDYSGHKNTVETDQESSLIQAVHKYIGTTGDISILSVIIHDRTVLDRLEYALEYLLNNRFSPEYGLLWGATTVDWGDVQPEHDWGVVLDENSHRAIDIYDNAMFVIALSNYLDMVKGDTEKVTRWNTVRENFRQNIRKHLWDNEKQKYKPHIYLDGSPFPPDFNEDEIFYHGGTAVAVEAGLLSQDEIAASLARMVDNVKQSGAPSIGLTVYPPYPKGLFKNPGMSIPYSYQNGGDWTWFGGRYGPPAYRARLCKRSISRTLTHDRTGHS